MAWAMQRVNSASILTVEPRRPFVQRLRDELNKRNVQTQVEVIREPTDLINKRYDSDLLAFEVDSVSRSNSQLILRTIPTLILNEAIVKHKVFVSDNDTAELLTSHLKDNAIDESLSAQLNVRSLRLALRFADLEKVTQEWVDEFNPKSSAASPDRISLELALSLQLRYGENPHQKEAGLYRLIGENRPGVTTARQLQGKELSYNNIADADAAFECVAEFDPGEGAACVIVKHANPCGVAQSESLAKAYERALACDPVSAFGGIVAVNRTLDAATASQIGKVFTEVIIAPKATAEAQLVISKKKNVRLLLVGELPDPSAPGYIYKSVSGALLRQPRDNTVASEMKPVTKRRPTNSEMADLLFAFRVAKHVKSNAIVYAKDLATVGIGAGQMSRVDSARIAARKAEDAARELKLRAPLTQGSVVASDAFFPFADGLEAAIEAGATAVIQPGGSMRDDEVIKAADKRGVAMVFTGTRHFRH